MHYALAVSSSPFICARYRRTMSALSAVQPPSASRLSKSTNIEVESIRYPVSHQHRYHLPSHLHYHRLRRCGTADHCAQHWNLYLRLMPYIAGSVTPKYAEIAAGTTDVLCLGSRLLLKMMMPTTAEACAMFDSAIRGQIGVPPKSCISCRSTALVVWWRPVITKGVV